MSVYLKHNLLYIWHMFATYIGLKFNKQIYLRSIVFQIFINIKILLPEWYQVHIGQVSRQMNCGDI